MRKNEMIEILQAIKGNPEVVIYNPCVGDWLPIDREIFVERLVRSTPKADWELKDQYYNPDFHENRTKPVVLLQGTRRGKKTFDRTGIIEY